MFVPDELRKTPNWVLWRLENRDGKSTKIPYYSGGKMASTTDPSTWAAYETIEQDLTQQYDGIGFCAGEKPGTFILIDIDHCISADGTVSELATTIIQKADSYTEISPSGKGIHIFAGGHLVQSKKTEKAEIYGHSRYFTFTGDIYNNKKIFRVLSPQDITEIYKMIADTGPAIDIRPMNDTPQGTCTMQPDEILNKIGGSKNGEKILALYNGETDNHGNNASRADMALCCHLAFWCSRDAGMIDRIFRTSKLMRPKWDEKRGTSTYGQRTIFMAISGCKETYTARTHETYDRFWYADESNPKKIQLKIDNAKMLDFLTNNGYTKYYPVVNTGEPKPSFVFIKNRLVSLSSKEEMSDALNKFIDIQKQPVLPDTDFSAHTLKNLFIKGIDTYLSLNRLQCIRPSNIKFYRDGQSEAAIFYNDYWAQIDKENIVKRPYSEMEGYLWKNQKINRNFPAGNIDDTDGEFEKFVSRACGNNADTIMAVTTSLGYLLHRFKNPALIKAIILLDAVISDCPSGRSGKSLILSGLSKIRNVVILDGKNFDGNDDRFAFQNVSEDTDIAVLDDIKDKFNFESVFHLITGDFGIEKKGKQKQILPFEQSPKIAFTSNYMLNGEGPSFEARVHEIALPSIYTKEFTPEMDFGHKLFIDWDENEWCKFDWFMMRCIQYYFNMGLIAYKHENIDKRKKIQATSEIFVQFMDDYFKDYKQPAENMGFEVKKDLYNSYCVTAGENQNKFTMKTFGKCLSRYFRLSGINFISENKMINGERLVCFRIEGKI
jgi:primase-polymerase (primpol)-like protein